MCMEPTDTSDRQTQWRDVKLEGSSVSYSYSE